MSATRDKTQKITFVYSSLYSIYRQGVQRARDGAVKDTGSAQASLAGEALNTFLTTRSPSRLNSGAVLKTADLNRPATPLVPRVSPYSPAELIGKRLARQVQASSQSQLQTQCQAAQPLEKSPPSSPVESLKQNLQSLNDLQARLRFMLQELEDLIKDER